MLGLCLRPHFYCLIPSPVLSYIPTHPSQALGSTSLINHSHRNLHLRVCFKNPTSDSPKPETPGPRCLLQTSARLSKLLWDVQLASPPNSINPILFDPHLLLFATLSPAPKVGVVIIKPHPHSPSMISSQFPSILSIFFTTVQVQHLDLISVIAPPPWLPMIKDNNLAMVSETLQVSLMSAALNPASGWVQEHRGDGAGSSPGMTLGRHPPPGLILLRLPTAAGSLSPSFRKKYS